jgi:hypothetical protein
MAFGAQYYACRLVRISINTGSGSNITVTGLSPGALYFVKVVESSGRFDSLNYQQDQYAMDSARTMLLPATFRSPSVPASGITVTGITGNTATIHCVPGDGRLYHPRGHYHCRPQLAGFRQRFRQYSRYALKSPATRP